MTLLHDCAGYSRPEITTEVETILLGNRPGSTLAFAALQALSNTELAILGQQILAETEQQVFAGFSHRQRRLEWLGGRLAAKTATARLLNSIFAGPELAVLADANGRPRLQADAAGGEPVDLSISHSRGLAVALAASSDCCGIDLQQITTKVNKVRERFSTPGERDLVDTAAPQDPAASLTILWAAKEALRKALSGLFLPGFLELLLVAATVPTDGSGTAVDLGFRLEPSRPGMVCWTSSLSVRAMFFDDFALAVTFVARKS